MSPAPEKPRARKSFAKAAIARTGVAPAVVYVARADLGRLLTAARAVVAMETETARNSHAAPGRRDGRPFLDDWRAGDPGHFETVRELDAARQRITRSIARR